MRAANTLRGRSPAVLLLALLVLASCKGKGRPPEDVATDAASTAAVEAANGKAKDAIKLWDGVGVPQDRPGARKVFDETCAAGSQLGCTGLAITYLDGIDGTGKDYKKALALLQPACDAKIARACSALGNIYAFGEGVTKDESKAADLYKTACDGGEPRGCFRLGVFYTSGSGGLPKDAKHALDLFKQTCDASFADGCFALATLYKGGSGVAKSKTDAAKYAQQACEGGSAEGCALLSGFYDEGDGVTKDQKKSAELAGKSCDMGSAGGCAVYGGMLLGSNKPGDRTMAAEVFKKACDLDNDLGCYGLAQCKRQGWGVERNPMGADTLMKKACDLGSATACKEFKR